VAWSEVLSLRHSIAHVPFFPTLQLDRGKLKIKYFNPGNIKGQQKYLILIYKMVTKSCFTKDVIYKIPVFCIVLLVLVISSNSTLTAYATRALFRHRKLHTCSRDIRRKSTDRYECAFYTLILCNLSFILTQMRRIAIIYIISINVNKNTFVLVLN